MTLTRDQLRAARILLHLQQDELAVRAKVSVVTLRRFEGGKKVGALYVDALRRAIENEGAVLVTGNANEDPEGGVGRGVALRNKLPEATAARIRAATGSPGEDGESADGAADIVAQPEKPKGRRPRTPGPKA